MIGFAGIIYQCNKPDEAVDQCSVMAFPHTVSGVTVTETETEIGKIMEKNYPFTVTHVLGLKQEVLYPAMKVQIDNDFLFIWESGNENVVREITGGEAYVSNQAGKTVAKYVLES